MDLASPHVVSVKNDFSEIENDSGKIPGKDESIDNLANGSTRPSFAHLDEKKILRKMDIRVIPVLALLYLLSFLDRGNIGNAKIEGLQEDLNMSDDQYNWCLTVFFFTYAAFEVPSNLVLKKLRPSRWLPSIMVAWGIVMTLMGIVQSYHGLLIARIFLGVTEAGLFPGVAYYLTMWYCRSEIQFRQALFFSAASIAGAFSGLLAFAIAKMDGIAGLEGWRWIFILEGIATVIVALFAFFALFDFPETASFLTREEREFVIHRLKYQGSRSGKNDDNDVPVVEVAEADEFKWEYVRQAFCDGQIYINILVYWGIVCPLYGVSLFLPTIIKGLGYHSSTAQLLTIPIYIVAAITAIFFSWLSDRVGMRSPFIIVAHVVMLLGYAMCIGSSNPRVVYGGIFVATLGIYPAFPGVISWMSNNLSGSYKRSAGMALQIGVGNLAGAMAANFYRGSNAPRYFLGHGLELGFVMVGLLAAVVLVSWYMRTNKSRARRLANGEALNYTSQELASQGDRAITFRYVY